MDDTEGQLQIDEDAGDADYIAEEKPKKKKHSKKKKKDDPPEVVVSEKSVSFRLLRAYILLLSEHVPSLKSKNL